MTDKNLLVITLHRKEPGKQRIAAYCRVSSRSDEQLNSLANQIDFYRSRFENDDTVVFVGIYAEEGLSGTQAKSRPQFMKMIEDCRSGMIDRLHMDKKRIPVRKEHRGYAYLHP